MLSDTVKYYHIMGVDLGIGPGTPALCRRVAEHLTSRASVGAILSDPIGVEKMNHKYMDKYITI